MNVINRVELQQLADHPDDHCVSLYMPGAIGADSRQNPVRFKNLLRGAEQRLADQGLEATELQELFAPARELLDHPSIWHEIAHGLALLLARDGARFWKLPIACEQTCVVGRHFYLLPLLEWLPEDTSIVFLEKPA